MSLRHLHHLFPIRSVVNMLFKLTLELLFFKKIQNKKNKKIQNLQGIKFEEKKEVEDSIYFFRLLRHQAIKNNKLFFHLHTEKF